MGLLLRRLLAATLLVRRCHRRWRRRLAPSRRCRHALLLRLLLARALVCHEVVVVIRVGVAATLAGGPATVRGG